MTTLIVPADAIYSAITSPIALYAMAVSHKKFELLDMCFAADARYLTDGDIYDGRGAVVDYITMAVRPTIVTTQILGSSYLELADDGDATSQTPALVYHLREIDGVMTVELNSILYTDRIRRSAERWEISERSFVLRWRVVHEAQT